MKKSNFSFSRVAGAALCAAAMIFIGCAQAFDASKSKVFGSITLDLSIEGVPKVVQNSTGPLFTVYPAAENFSNFTLSFTALSEGADHADVTVTDISIPVTINDLVLGIYKITVTAARAGSGEVVAMGEITNIEVTAAAATTPVEVEIIMEPKKEGGVAAGTLAYNIVVPVSAASATLKISDMNSVAVTGYGSIDVKTNGTGAIVLDPGYYWAEVALDDGTGGFEAVHIYSGLTSTWDVEFTKAGEEGLLYGGIAVTIGFGENIPVTVEPGNLTVTQGDTITFSVTDNSYTGVKWHTDGNISASATNAEYEVDTTSLALGAHTVTVRAVHSGRPYRDIHEFTVTENVGGAGDGGGGGETLSNIDATGLAAALANVPAGAADSPTTIVFNSFDINSNVWGETIYTALNGNTKYLVLDLSACTATSNTITGASTNPSGNNFNRIASEYIVGVILPSSLTSIGENAFCDWTGLKSCVIPSSVTSIGGYAFSGTGLTSIIIPANVTTLGLWFLKNTPLTSITFLGNNIVNYNENGAFANVQGTALTDYTKSIKSNFLGTHIYNNGSWSKQED